MNALICKTCGNTYETAHPPDRSKYCSPKCKYRGMSQHKRPLPVPTVDKLGNLHVPVGHSDAIVSPIDADLLADHYWYKIGRYAAARNRGGYIFLTRAIAERLVGRELRPEEVVFRKNKHPMDNRRENLFVSTWAEERRKRSMKCAVCSVEFVPKTMYVKTCSRTCYQQSLCRPRQLRPDAIQGSNGEWILVSPEDIDYLRQFRWYVSDKGYAVCRSSKKTLRMHRVVLERSLGRRLEVNEYPDHKHGNTLDNRRSELRVATRSQNTANSRRRHSSKSGYRCVTRTRGGKWSVKVAHIYVCSTDDVDHAAWMADQWMIALYGEFARTNFEYV